MKFVTKKEFEDAIVVIQSALKNGQVTRSIHDDVTFPLSAVHFSTGHTDLYEPNEVSFVNPAQAIKMRLHSIRNDLKGKRSAAAEYSQKADGLEKEEKQLVTILATLKE